MTSEIKQSLNKHEMILERYKSILFSEKNKPSNKNIINIKDPINEINYKTLKIKENIDLGLNAKNLNDLNSNIADANFNKTEKKLDEILNKANFAVFDNQKKNQLASNTKNLSSSEQVRKIIQENNISKNNEAKNSNKVSKLIKKYETIDQYNKNPENVDHKSYLENLKLDQQAKNTNLNNIIEKNNNLIENLKKKYLSNIKQNTASTPSNSNVYSEFKFPIQKIFKENETNFLSFSGNSFLSENQNTKAAFKTINSSSALLSGKRFNNNDDADFDNQDTISKINLLRQKYLSDERQKSALEVNKLFKDEKDFAFPSANNNNNINNHQEKETSLSKDPEINSIINKYKSKLGCLSSNGVDYYSKENNDKHEEAKKTEKSSNFNSKLDEVNKKIDGINFTFQKGENDLINFNCDTNQNYDQDDIMKQMINKKIEREKKELVDKEKSKFDFIFKNKENIANLLFKFKLTEKFSLDENTENNYINEFYYDPLTNKSNNNTEETKNKKGFINKINFIEEKLNRIENLINFEEKEINKNNKLNELKYFHLEENNKNKKKFLSENENASDYPENFTLGNLNSKNVNIKSVKQSVFSELNKNEDFTTDEEKQSNHILSFAQNIRNLKELKEKNSQMIEEIEDKKIYKKKDKELKIPLNKKSKVIKSDFSDKNESDSNSNNYDSYYANKIIGGFKSNEKNEDKEFQAKKILNNLIETEKIFENNSKDFIDEEMEKERKSLNSHHKKSADGNQNSSVINNMTLSYSISSNEKSEEAEEINEEEYYVKKGKDYDAGYMSNPSDEENQELNSSSFKEPNEIKISKNENRNASFYDFDANSSPKSNRSRSRIKKPIKNLISFDEFLNSN